MKYDVFISYSRKDYVDEQKNVIPGNEVSKVKDALVKAGITYWFDEEGIYYGQNFVEKIVTNIENAKVFLFLSTANANNSPWTCKEIASADEFNKHIIPVRIDATPYNKKVLFRIADLDYIEYYTNPKKGMEDLIKSIQTYLAELAAEEKRKKEEEYRRIELERKKEEELKKEKEQEKQREREKQERLISEIKLACATLNNAEAKLELDREDLLLKIGGITDRTQQDTLADLIKQGGTIHQKYQKENSDLVKKIKEIKSIQSYSSEEIRERDQQIEQLKSELEILKSNELKYKETSNHLIGQIGDLQKKLKESPIGNTDNKKSRRRISLWGHGLYLCVIIIIVTYGFFLLKERDSWKSDYYQKHRELIHTQTLIGTLSDFQPLIVKGVEMVNEDGNSIIKSSLSFKYIGFKDGKEISLLVKLYGIDGRTSETYARAIKVSGGENSQVLVTWEKSWPKGAYSIEIWYDERILAEQTFVIH